MFGLLAVILEIYKKKKKDSKINNINITEPLQYYSTSLALFLTFRFHTCHSRQLLIVTGHLNGLSLGML